MTQAGIKELNGIAAGMGLERIAMIKYGISDIRDLFNNDFKFTNQFRKEKI
jgi:phenylalanyl-tRNA synthetase alpha chain